jgi:hypothetical protein
MVSSERRLGLRVPLPIYLNQYIEDRPLRALASDVSPTGIHVKTVKLPLPRPASRTVALELELPGTGETIWARGEIRYQRARGGVESAGIRFTAMPSIYAKLLRDYCAEARRDELARLLERIRAPLA